MIGILKKYSEKLSAHGLSEPRHTAFFAIDAGISQYGGAAGEIKGLEDALIAVFGKMNISSLVFAIPSEPYLGILRELLKWGIGSNSTIVPEDCETRTFFHDIPVIEGIDPEGIAGALAERKSVITAKMPAIISYGTVSPEQAFISFSSTCFSTFVKYFYDHLRYLNLSRKSGTPPDPSRLRAFEEITMHLAEGPRLWSESLTEEIPIPALKDMGLRPTKPENEQGLLRMMQEAGRKLVEERLVDSYFGNISAYYNETIYISETAASLDELEGAIDPVPVDGSSSIGITASSEFPTHRSVYSQTPYRFILHGHPKFSVIMSMVCEKECPFRGRCHRACPEKRHICGAPVVPGEIGTGPAGIVNTVPRAFKKHDTVIVLGHGVFTAGTDGFQRPLLRMKEIEACAMKEYFRNERTYSGYL